MHKKKIGFSLIELILVITLIVVLAGVTIPKVTGFISIANERACLLNRSNLNRTYHAFLFLNDYDHINSLFYHFLVDNYGNICPNSGEIIYMEGDVICSIHSENVIRDEIKPPEHEVPWL
ncbi:MAG: type II secretion system protein [Erysipelotrichia bacterium]|nr:type II secretion system protein [Erysipelotrichia bacterium]